MMNERGFINSVIDTDRMKDVLERNGYSYEVGMLQPATLALDKKSSVLYTWSSIPGPQNIQGAAGRPSPRAVWKAVQRTLSGDYSLVQGKPSAESIPIPLFVALVMAHGNFIYPKPFFYPHEKKGIRYALGVILLVGVATLAGLIKSPKPTLAAHSLYALYFYAGGPWDTIKQILGLKSKL